MKRDLRFKEGAEIEGESDELIVIGCGLGWLVEREMDEIGEVSEVGFFNSSRFQAEGQGVRVRGNCNGGEFKKFLFHESPSVWRFVVSIFPADRNESDRNGVQEFRAIEAVSYFGHRIDIAGEFDLLK